MDQDLNKYDLNHRVTHHPKMSDAEWEKVYTEVWDRFYSWEHMETILRRMVALGSSKRHMTVNRLLVFHDFHRLYGVHPLEGGFLRIKSRKDRRYGMKRENPLAFYARLVASEIRNSTTMMLTHARLKRTLARILADPERRNYRDIAITPPDLDELSLALYTETRGGAAEIEKKRHQQDIVRKAQAKSGTTAEPVLTAAE
jgi:hypothetical protein